MDISSEIAAIQAASQGSELRQPLVGALNKLNSGSLPAVTVSDVGKILKVGANGWEVGEKTGYMPVPTATKQIAENGTYDVTDYASAIVSVSGGGGSSTILSGVAIPTVNIGIDGDIYLKYGEYTYYSFINGTIVVRENNNDNTDIKLFVVGLEKTTAFMPLTDNDLLDYLSDITSGYLKGCSSYDSIDSNTQTGILAIGNWGNGIGIHTYNTSWANYKGGTFYGMLDLVQPPVSTAGAPAYQHNDNKKVNTDITSPIDSAYLKINNAWQNLIGSDINSVNA